MKIGGISEWSNQRLISGTGLVRSKRKRALLPAVLFAIAGLLGLLAVAKATGLYIASARAQRIVRQATAWNKPDPNAVESQVANSKLLAEGLKEQNLFSPSPKEHPVKAVLGILGNEAYIDGKWYKVGAKIGDAKIVAIDAASVTTEWEGKETVFQPIDAEGSPAPGGPRPGPDRPAPRPDAMGPGGAEVAVIQSGAPPMRGPEAGQPGMGGGPQPSEQDEAKMKEEMEKVKE